MNPYHTNEGLMAREDLTGLARAHDMNCISIYLPAGRAGEEVDRKHAQLRLKKILGELEGTLDLKTAGEGLKRSLKELLRLKGDGCYFRHQSDGLAIFIGESGWQAYTLPVRFRQQVYVSDHYYLLPLLPFFNDNGMFYLMALSLKKVNLYECTRHTITEIDLEHVAPRSMEEVVGTDYENKSLQYRTSGPSGGKKSEAIYHGQGSGKDDREKEADKFFREVDQAVTPLLGKEETPLVLACVDHYLPAYREITRYRHLFPKHIPGNPDNTDPLMLHEEGWALVREHFTGKRKEKRELTRQWSATGKTSYDAGEIVPAALDGRIETLFVQEGKDRYGLFDREKGVIREQPERKHRVSLYNMAAAHTLLNGGDVFLETAADMPFKESELNALFRYDNK